MQAWKRTYRVVFVANLVTAIGMMSFLPFFPAYLKAMGVHDDAELKIWSGLVFGAAPFAAAIMGPIWGSIGDRSSRKAMVLRAQIAIALAALCMGFANSPMTLLLLRIGQGVFSGFVPPSITLVSVAAPREKQGRIAGTLQAALAAGSVVGPLVGALLQHAFGLRSVFFFVAAAALVSGLLVAFFAQEDRELRVSIEGWSPTMVLRAVGQDLVKVWRVPRMRAAFVFLAAVQFGIGASNPLMQLYVEEIWTGAAERIPDLTSLLFTAVALASFFATPLWGRVGDRLGHGKVLVRATLLTALVLIGHGFASLFALLLLLRLVLGVGASGVNAAAFGSAGRDTPQELRGSAFGVIFSARALSVSLGAMSGGALASLLGIDGLFWAMGASLLVLSLVLTRRMRQTAVTGPLSSSARGGS